MFFPSSRWSQERREILSVIQGSSLHNGSLHVTAKIETMGARKEEKMALKCDVSVENGEAENHGRSGATIFAFYFSILIKYQLCKMLMGYNFFFKKMQYWKFEM